MNGTCKIVLKNILYIVLFFAISQVASYIGIFYFEETLQYIAPEQIPDPPTAYLLGGFLAYVLSSIFNIHAMLFFAIAINVKRNEISLASAVITKVSGKAEKIICVIGYVFATGAVLNIVKDIFTYRAFIPLSLPYFISCAVTFMTYVVMLNSFMKKSPQRDKTN